MYLDSLGSLVLLLTCGAGPLLIAYLVVDDLIKKVQQRRNPLPVIAPPAPEPVVPRRAGWFAWAS